MGDQIEFSQYRRICIADLVEETLQLMEKKGGPGAGGLIRTYVPTFDSYPSGELHRGFR